MTVFDRHEDETRESPTGERGASEGRRRFGWPAIGGGILCLLVVLAIVVLHHVHEHRVKRLASVVTETSVPIVTPVALPPGWDGPRPTGVPDEVWHPAVDAAPTIETVEQSVLACDSAMSGTAPACLVAAVCTARLARVEDSHATGWRARSENQWLVACEEILPECAAEADPDQRRSAAEALVRLSAGPLPVAPAVSLERDRIHQEAEAQPMSPPWTWDFFEGREANALRTLEDRLARWRRLRDLPDMQALRSVAALDEEETGYARAVRRGLQLCALGIANAGREDFDGEVLQGLEARQLRLFDDPADVELSLEPWSNDGDPTDADRRLATGLAEVFADRERLLRGCWSRTRPGDDPAVVIARVSLDEEGTIRHFRFDQRELTLPSDRSCWAHALVGLRVSRGAGTAGEHAFRIRAHPAP